ncbi:DNA alkylation repair protein [Amycolatopsis anabasis]|uniref:DNA alkylation repair protein n=1 Tax=Amycolatopsis anabasis TaxID=1840409 RepID=UPI00131DD888|nr:DNA alkylation repair protein [Amycolatopsis anabasis]
MESVAAFVQAARTGLAGLADPVKAPEMQRYMKSEMPFRGVPKPLRSRLARTLFAEHPLSDRDSFVAAVLRLWREAEYREERYLAIDLTGDRRYARWQDPDLLPVYEELIVTGAWWDFVDEVAIRRVGPLLRAKPEALTPVLRRWSTDPDRWRRRTAVICQVGAKQGTDLDLLTEVIESNLDDRDFFLRKGIGWALREYAKTGPGWVRSFVRAHPGLSPLSVREALKHVGAA